MRNKINFSRTHLKTEMSDLWAFTKKHPARVLQTFTLSGFGFIFLFILLIYVGVFGKIPSESALNNLRNPLTSTIYSSDNKQLGFYYLQNRSNIDSTQMNDNLVNALVATEDARFYQHGGIDYRSFGRVFVKSIILRKESAGGGSTVTQQIAKNIFGRRKQPFLSTPINKIREMFIANRLESIYDKQDILLLYFNTVSFGENIYGIEKAANRYFAKKPKELSLEESAALVGLLKAPSYYNPRNNPERAQERRNVVLQQMVKYNYITQEIADVAKTKPLKLKYQEPVELSSLKSYLKNAVKKEFDLWAEDNAAPDGHTYDLEADGLKIYTTVHSSVQQYAENAVETQIKQLQRIFDDNWTSATTEGGKEGLIKAVAARISQVEQMQANGRSQEEIEAFLNEKKPRQIWEIGKGPILKEQTVKDSIVNALTRLHTGVLAMNSKTGGVLAYVGGIDYGFSQYDNITLKNQVGSTFKPISYLSALENGIEPCSFFDNQLRTYPEYENWQPRNANGRYGGSYSTHGALANSVNTASVRLQMRVGTANVIKMAEKMGITSPIPNQPSIVLGTADISLLEMVTAYASISNGGLAVKPHIIDRIVDQDGTVIYKAENRFEGRIASENNVNQIQKMMEGVINGGTGSGFHRWRVPYNIIGKTGTTQNNGDGWFIGASPEVVIGAWVGTLDKRVQFNSTRYGAGASTAMPMVASVFAGMSSWRKPMLSNFRYNFKYFPCPQFSDSSASNAYYQYKNDTTYVRNLLIRDSIAEATRRYTDSIRKDSLYQLELLKQNLNALPVEEETED